MPNDVETGNGMRNPRLPRGICSRPCNGSKQEGKRMLKSMLVALTVFGVPAVAAGAAIGPRQPAPPASPKVQVAQACWYAIMLCSTSRSEATRWSNNNGIGYVINTSSDEFPNFRAGYYCVVEGPMGQGRAQATANSYRGISPTAYAKSGC
jgi:hypothetical protein